MSGRAAAWAIHLYTASGLFFALLAAVEVCSTRPDPRRVFVWLAITVLIDATDGPLARRFQVKKVLPHIDGRKIDDIVDYLTYTFLPLLLMVRMQWLPDPALLFVAPAAIASVLGFANEGAKDEVHGFFLGFPSYWNVVAFYAGLAAPLFGPWPNAIALLLLAVMTLLPLGFIYPNLAPRRWRVVMIAGAAVWALLLAAMLPAYPASPVWLMLLSLLYPLFYTGVSFIEYGKRP